MCWHVYLLTQTTDNVLPDAREQERCMPNGGAHAVSWMAQALCAARRIMPIVLERGGPIPGIIMLIIAGCGAWSLWGPIWSWPATFLLVRARARSPRLTAPLHLAALLPGMLIASPAMLGSTNTDRLAAQW